MKKILLFAAAIMITISGTHGMVLCIRNLSPDWLVAMKDGPFTLMGGQSNPDGSLVHAFAVPGHGNNNHLHMTGQCTDGNPPNQGGENGNVNCWCRLTSPVESAWVFHSTHPRPCAMGGAAGCSWQCHLRFTEDQAFRVSMIP